MFCFVGERWKGEGMEKEGDWENGGKWEIFGNWIGFRLVCELFVNCLDFDQMVRVVVVSKVWRCLANVVLVWKK